jgi:hypothetical protein
MFPVEDSPSISPDKGIGVLLAILLNVPSLVGAHMEKTPEIGLENHSLYFNYTIVKGVNDAAFFYVWII